MAENVESPARVNKQLTTNFYEEDLVPSRGELTSKASEILESLNLGADESEVEALEEYIGQELPTDYRDFLIMHSQSQESNPGFFDMLASCHWISYRSLGMN